MPESLFALSFLRKYRLFRPIGRGKCLQGVRALSFDVIH